MENIDNNENMNILEDLDRKSASPSLQFKSSLRNRVISDFLEEPVEGRFFFSERVINYLSIFIVILSVGIVAGAGIISFNNGNQVLNIDNVAAVPASEKPGVLEGIIKNNPDALILQTDKVVSNDPTNIASVAETAQQVSVTSEVKGYNFSYTKASTEFGKNIVCSSNTAVTTEVLNYSEGNLTYYRVNNYDKSNNIIDSVQVKTQDDVATSLYSRGGLEYLMFSANNLESNKEPTSFPVSSPQVTSENIDKYFDGTQNLNEVTRDGAKYYVLETLGVYNCNGVNINAVFKKWFNKADFSLYQKETYKTNSTEVNLIERTTYNVANQQVKFDDVSDNFYIKNPVLDTDSVLDITKYNSLETLLKFIPENLETVPGNSTISNLQISNFVNLSSMSRGFYNSDDSYILSINKNPKPFFKYSLNNVSVETYSLDVSNDSLFSNLNSGLPQDIKIGDDFYTGQLFINTLPVSFSGSTAPKQVLILEKDGIKYVFSSTNLDSIIKNGLSSLSLLDIFDANKI